MYVHNPGNSLTVSLSVCLFEALGNDVQAQAKAAGLNANASEFVPPGGLNANAPEFVPPGGLNANALEFVPLLSEAAMQAQPGPLLSPRSMLCAPAPMCAFTSDSQSLFHQFPSEFLLN